jgi:ATP-dependent DNA ligase
LVLADLTALPAMARRPLPAVREPMAATQLSGPFHRPGWAYEEKADGWRVLAYKEARGVRLVGRAGWDPTRPPLNTASSRELLQDLAGAIGYAAETMLGPNGAG